MSNSSSPQMKARHGFLLMGKDNVFGCHLPMFFKPAHAFQVIFESSFEDKVKEKYLAIKKDNPGKPLIIFNPKPMEPVSLEEIANSGSFECSFYFSTIDGDPDGNPLIENVNILVKKVLFEPLIQNNDYPENLSYYLYGKDSEYHLSHILTKAPNFQQEIDISISDNIVDTINKMNNSITRISIPSLSEKSEQPIVNDPLNQSQYTINMDNGITGTINIGSKYWINNGPLNMQMQNMNMNEMNM
jgi:hypothetical protein